MKKSTIKKAVCIMLSAALVGEASLWPSVGALSKEDVGNMAHKAAPYIAYIGMPVVVTSWIISAALKNKSVSEEKQNAKDSDAAGADGRASAEFVDQNMVNSFVLKGMLPGINLVFRSNEGFFRFGGSRYVKYGYVVQDEKVARLFLTGFCRLGENDVKKFFEMNNTFFDYSDENRKNPIVKYSVLWTCIKNVVDMKESEATPNKSVTTDEGASVVAKDTENSERSAAKVKSFKLPNSELIERIKCVEAIGGGESKYAELYEDLRDYYDDKVAGQKELLKQKIREAVFSGLMPGLILLCYQNQNLYIKGKVWYGYRIADKKAFKGYLKLRLELSDNGRVDEIFDLFKSREQKLFLHPDESGGVLNGWLQWHYREVLADGSLFQNQKEFFEDFRDVGSLDLQSAKTRIGIIDFSNFERQPSVEYFANYKEFLKACNFID